MNWTLVTQDGYLTTRWSGGKTTQLAIAPAGAAYAERDFLWRLSSATVELEQSTFTPLPDYDRVLTVLHGRIDLKVGASRAYQLIPYQVCAFDGAEAVESRGKCKDFNLMLRKGRCTGSLHVIRLKRDKESIWTVARRDPVPFSNRTVALYCAEGCVELPDEGRKAREGQLLLGEAAEGQTLALRAETDTVIIGAVMVSGKS